MAKTAKQKQAVRRTRTIVRIPRDIEEMGSEPVLQEPIGSRKPSVRMLFFGILLIGLLVLFFINKSILIAASVNGKPIFRWQLNTTMSSRYGQQTLEGMIGELLIEDAAKNEGVSVNQGMIDAKVAEIIGSLGNDVDIEELLRLQGMTRDEFENQVRLQMTVEQVFAKNLTITETDVDQYIATNAGRFSATDAATIRLQARQAITDDYVSSKFQPWFAELKERAKITRYL